MNHVAQCNLKGLKYEINDDTKERKMKEIWRIPDQVKCENKVHLCPSQANIEGTPSKTFSYMFSLIVLTVKDTYYF